MTYLNEIDLVRQKIRDVLDFPKQGILFRDITPILACAETSRVALRLHRKAIDDLVEAGIDRVCGIEARGFLFGMSLAAELDVAFTPIRKPGKLPSETISQSFDLEYGSDRLEVHVDGVGKGEKIVVVDDLLATGGTANAACQLIEELGGSVVSCLFLIELGFLNGREKLEGRRVDSIVHYD